MGTDPLGRWTVKHPLFWLVAAVAVLYGVALVALGMAYLGSGTTDAEWGRAMDLVATVGGFASFVSTTLVAALLGFLSQEPVKRDLTNTLTTVAAWARGLQGAAPGVAPDQGADRGVLPPHVDAALRRHGL